MVRDKISNLQTDICFYCSHSVIGGKFVQWDGSNAIIVLHPQCVIDLTLRMGKDVHKIQCETNTQAALTLS
jgi:hypothetical protein